MRDNEREFFLLEKAKGGVLYWAKQKKRKGQKHGVCQNDGTHYLHNDSETESPFQIQHRFYSKSQKKGSKILDR